MMRVVASGMTRHMSRDASRHRRQRITQRRHNRLARSQVGLLQPGSERAGGQRRWCRRFQRLRAFAQPRRDHSLGADFAGDAGPGNVVFCHEILVVLSTWHVSPKRHCIPRSVHA